jgi:hypothetical protein
MMDMKDSPRFVETNMWAMASRRSGRKAWIRSRRWMACPMGAETSMPSIGEGTHFEMATLSCLLFPEHWLGRHSASKTQLKTHPRRLVVSSDSLRSEKSLSHLLFCMLSEHL